MTLWTQLFNLFAYLFPRPVTIDVPMPPTPLPPLPESPTERIAEAAISMLGRDATPYDEVPDEVACVASLVAIMPPEFGLDRKLTYTPALFAALKKSPRFTATLTPEKGCIIVSPTIGDMHGHCGIFISDTLISSNNSFGKNKGKWTQNYTFDGWVKYFKLTESLHTYIFKPI